MPERDYDLNALVQELRQAGAGGMHDARSLARFTSLIRERTGCATASEAFDRMYADWHEIPAKTMQSGIFAGQLLLLVPLLQHEQPCGSPEKKEELLLAALSHGPVDPQWHAGLLAVTGGAALGDNIHADPAQSETALARLDQAAAMMPSDSPGRDAIDAFRAFLRAKLYAFRGGKDELDRSIEELERLRETPALDADARLVLAGHIAVMRCHQAERRQDEDALAKSLGELEAAVAQLGSDHRDRAPLQEVLNSVRNSLVVMRARRTGSFPEGSGVDTTGASADEIRRQASELPDSIRADRLGMSGVSRLAQASLAQDAGLLAEALGLLEEALGLLEPDDERWVRYANALGTGHCTAAHLSAPADALRHLDQGIAWLRHTLRLVRGPEYPDWASLSMVLASAYRIRGDRCASNARTARLNYNAARRIGLEGIRGIAWNVLLQSSTAHAAETGRLAGEYALDVARWCLVDGAYDDAVRSLDAGRGLTLYAATVVTTVPDMLVGLGHPELAEEWRAAGPVLPEPERQKSPPADITASGPSSRLRRRVLDVLAASPLRQRLLHVPSASEIGTALRAMGHTALVYLVPAGEVPEGRTVHGAALMVLPDGTARPLRLPGLDVRAAPVAEYRPVGAPGRDAGGPPTKSPSASPRQDSRAALEQLCDWAGETVLKPLLKELPRSYGDVPSVVLVPMGELSMVPWHAARVPAGRGRYRYACEDVRISSVPSARLLCEVAARPAAGVRRTLVVGNPTRDLHHAGQEAEAIRHTFHPGGELLGPGTATPAAVTEWLGRQSGGLLHLACHGKVQPGKRHSSYLELSGGRLAAEELTEGVDRYRGLELVVLAACSTHVSGHGYDEAYSLATAFLVAGARSVLGSLWPVPDDTTSLLMYMTHHYMSRDGLPPGQALRRAQLWMLNNQRQAPPGMPAHLAAWVPGIRGDDLTGWAGFTHLGW